MYKCNRPGCNKTAYIRSSLACSRCTTQGARRSDDTTIGVDTSFSQVASVYEAGTAYPSISITPDTSSSCDSSSYDSGSSSSDSGCSSD